MGSNSFCCKPDENNTAKPIIPPNSEQRYQQNANDCYEVFSMLENKQIEANIEQIKEITKQFPNSIQTFKSYLQAIKHSQIFTSQNLSKIQKDLNIYYFSNQEVEQILLFLNKYVQFCGINQYSDQKMQQIKFVSKLYHQNISQIDQQHCKALVTIRRLFTEQLQQPYKINLNDMSYDLGNKQQILHISKIVKLCCQQDYNAFYFLTCFIQQSCKKLAKQKNVATVDIQKRLSQLIKFLIQHHFWQQKIIGDTAIQFKECKKIEFSLGLGLHQIDQTQRNVKLQQFITNISQLASKNKELLIQLTQLTCLKNNGFKYEVRLKVKNQHCKSSIYKLKQQLLSDSVKKYQISQQNNTLTQFLKQQMQYYEQQVNKKISLQTQHIKFTVTDMLKGSCMFSNIENIKITAMEIYSKANQKGYSVEVDNKLAQRTANLIFKIKIRDIVCEFHLLYKMNTINNIFNQRLQELYSPNMYSVLTNLFIFNERSSQYFHKLMCRLKQIDKAAELKQLDSHGSQRYLINKAQLQKFKKYLNTIEQQLKIEFKKEQQTKQKMMKLINKIINIKPSFTTKNYHLLFMNGMLLKENHQVNQALNYFFNAKKMLKESQEQKLQLDQQLAYQIAQCFKAVGKNNEALTWFLKIVSYQKEENCIHIYYDIAKIYENQGNLSTALEYYLKSQRSTKNIKKIDHVDFIPIYNSIASVCNRLGNIDQAFSYYSKSLDILKNLKAEQTVSSAQIMNHIGQAYDSHGNFEEAIKHYENCLKLQQKIKGQNHIDCAIVNNKLGSLYKNLGKYSKAQQHYWKGLNIQIQAKGQQTIDCISTYIDMGTVYLNQYNYQLSLYCFKSALKIRQAKFGHNDKLAGRIRVKIDEILVNIIQ